MIDYYIARCSDFIKEELTTLQKIGAVAVLLLIICGWYFSYADSQHSSEKELVPISTKDQKETRAAKLFVHVAGQVSSPGLYELSEDKRVMDAIKLAGGPAANADLDSINLAEPVTDGMKITVPNKTIPVETLANDEEFKAGNSERSLININTANETELEALPGVGPATAKKIIDHRASSGSFKTIDELKNVKGIGAKKFDEMKKEITIY